MDTELQPGQEVFAFATGRLDPFQKGARDAFELMTELEGLVGINAESRDGNLLWLFDSEKHAKQGRNFAESNGIRCGSRVLPFVVDADGAAVLNVVELAIHGMGAK